MLQQETNDGLIEVEVFMYPGDVFKDLTISGSFISF